MVATLPRMGRKKKVKSGTVRVHQDLVYMIGVIASVENMEDVPGYLSRILRETVERDFAAAQKKLARTNIEKLRKEVEP